MVSTRKLIVLALLSILILSACGGNATPTATTAPTNPPPTVEATVEENVAVTEPPTAEITEAAQAVDTTEEAATPEGEVTSEGGAVASADGVMVMITQIDTSLRAGPGTAYAVAARATVNDTFPAVARFGEGRSLWYQITLPDGISAWAWSRVSTLTPADAELPVAEEIPPTPAS